MQPGTEYSITKADVEAVRECPVCGHTDMLLLSEVYNKEFNFLASSYCRKCGLVFRSTRPRLSWFEKSWNLREDSAPARQNQQLESFRRIRYAALSERLKEITSGKNLLDVGTGTGSGLLEFQKAGWNVAGVEPDIGRARLARNLGLQVVTAVADLEQQEFDVITIIHVLEHFHEPKKFIEQAVKNLKPAGFLYIEVPDIKSFVNWQDSLYLEHMNNFTDANLILLMAQLGFAPLFRFFPRTKPFGARHLGLLFKRTVGENAGVVKNELSIEYVKRLYTAGLNGIQNFPLRFRVAGIDDICMTLSRIPYPAELPNGDLSLLAAGSNFKKKLMQARSLSIKALLQKGLGRLKFLRDPEFVKLQIRKLG